MDCAYVGPNEPQMIDIMFIKSKHIGITSFWKMIDSAPRTPPKGFTITNLPLESILQLLAEYSGEVYL